MNNRLTYDLTGRRFGRLVAIKFVPESKGRWSCICDCGTALLVSGQSLRINKAKSCGCYKREVMAAGMNKRHGLYRTPTHKSWEAMIGRCTLPNDPSYDRYGGRGITVCERWLTFENFRADMGDRPDGMTIDRIENDDGYHVGNCRWATAKTQANNKSNSRRVEYMGRQLTMRELSDETGVNYQILRGRILKAGWTAERAVTTPIAHKCNSGRSA